MTVPTEFAKANEFKIPARVVEGTWTVTGPHGGAIGCAVLHCPNGLSLIAVAFQWWLDDRMASSSSIHISVAKRPTTRHVWGRGVKDRYEILFYPVPRRSVKQAIRIVEMLYATGVHTEWE